MADLPAMQLLRLYRSLHSRLCLPHCVPTFLFIRSTGISTCYPSTTALALALGPDLPRADQLYSGNLRYSAERILTFLSLLIPAFSLPDSPLLLPVQLLRVSNAPLPNPYTLRITDSEKTCFSVFSLRSSVGCTNFHSFGVVFQPRTFSAQDLSTSELLRTL